MVLQIFFPICVRKSIFCLAIPWSYVNYNLFLFMAIIFSYEAMKNSFFYLSGPSCVQKPLTEPHLPFGFILGLANTKFFREVPLRYKLVCLDRGIDQPGSINLWQIEEDSTLFNFTQIKKISVFTLLLY